MNNTKRVVNEGAEIWLQKPVKVLDHGFVYLVDYMGDDLCVEEAARVSYGPQSKKTSTSSGLLRYLVRHKHTSPLEMVDLKFHLKMPIFVARQWMRHRTASINEISGRYSVLPSEFYIPELENINQQSLINNQGRGEQIKDNDAKVVREHLSVNSQNAYDIYTALIEDYNLAKESSRSVLPVNVYTEFYWKLNLHNLLHFLNLRMDLHAQLEIREYAKTINTIVASGWPMLHQAFVDYVQESISFSAQEQDLLSQIIDEFNFDTHLTHETMSQRELAEFQQKIRQILDKNCKIKSL